MRKPLVVLELVACAGLIGGLIWAAARPATTTEAAAAAPAVAAIAYIAPTAAQIDLALHRVGITPTTLAAAGATAQQTTVIVDEAASILNANPTLLSSKDAVLFDAKNEMDRLVRLVRSGHASQQEIAECQQAIADHAAAKSNLESTLNTLFTDLTDQLPTATRNNLSMMRSHARWDMPIEFKVITREESEWLHLRRALANERIAAKDPDEEPDEDEQLFLTQMRANAQVALAKVNLDTNYQAIESAWNAALPQ